MTEKERNERFTKQALSHKDWNGRPIEGVTTTELPSFPKDKYGQVLIDDNIDSTVTKAYTGKSVMKKVNQVSPFENSPVVNAFTGF